MSRFIKPQTPYSQVPNCAMWDQRLSLSALGMWAFLWTLPEKWDFSVKGLATCRGCGITAATSAIQSLEKAGYLERIQRRDGTKFGGCDYKMIEAPAGAITIMRKKKNSNVDIGKSVDGKTVDGKTVDGVSVERKIGANKTNNNKRNNNKTYNTSSTGIDDELLDLLAKEGIK